MQNTRHMRVVLVYREFHNLEYSIEELFHAIAQEMGKTAEVIEYTTRSRSKIFADAWHLRKLNADIYHITGGINYMACLLPGKKTVLTMHDIVHYLYTLKGFKRFVYKWFWLILPIRHAHRVSAISTTTADALVKLPCLSNKLIDFIPNCYNPIFQPVIRTFNSNCPTIFQIGTLPHKNILRLIEAIQDIPCHLVLIGRLDGETKNLLQQYKISFENHVGITLGQIYQHYVMCDIVTFISLHEGFGVPIIEAQAVGRVVITSNTPPMSTVAGNGACLVNPQKVNEIRDGLNKIINDITYRNILINNGFNNVKNYSVGEITQRYLKLYQEMLAD